jgi:hypothetical protein
MSLFDWVDGSDVPKDNGDPVADGIKAGRATEYLEGELDELGGHPVRVAKYYRSMGNGDEWIVEVWLPNGPDGREITRTFDTDFTAEAVFEKIAREYNLPEWEPDTEGAE